MAGASVVVSHGGPGTIMGARRAGRVPDRRPPPGALGEHVDDHQVRFSRWMAERDQIELADSEATLSTLLEQAVADPTRYRLAGRGNGEGARAGAPAIDLFGDLIDGLLA